jgi:hypothetical protein
MESMSAVETSSERFDALVSGKRASVRLPVSVRVRLKAAERDFEAVAQNLSIQGALILLQEQQLESAEGQSLDPAAQFALIDRHLGKSFDIQFHEAQVVVEARLVRFTLSCENEGHLGLGCELVHPFSEKQARALGLMGEDEDLGPDWDVSVGVHDVRRACDPARPLTALLRDANEIDSSAVFLGPVALAGRRAIVVRVEGTLPGEVGAGLTDLEELQVCLARGTEHMTQVAATPVALRYVDGRRPTTDVLLSLSRRLPRAVWRYFKRVPSP